MEHGGNIQEAVGRGDCIPQPETGDTGRVVPQQPPQALQPALLLPVLLPRAWLQQEQLW